MIHFTRHEDFSGWRRTGDGVHIGIGVISQCIVTEAMVEKEYPLTTTDIYVFSGYYMMVHCQRKRQQDWTRAFALRKTNSASSAPIVANSQTPCLDSRCLA